MSKIAFLSPDLVVPAINDTDREQRFKVLTAELSHRLSQINAASRNLRKMGYRIVGEILCGTPTILIERGADGSIARLLDTAGKPYWNEKSGVKYGAAVFMNVTVTWKEA